jgi:hypothetical protein
VIPQRPDPNRDLTTEGVEPNPGPNKRGARDATTLMLGGFVKDLTVYGVEANPGPSPRVRMDYSAYPGYSQVAGNAFDDAVDFVFDTEPASDSWDDGFNIVTQEHLMEAKPAHVVPEPLLVGVETNPGPVTLPVKGRQLSSKMKKLAAEIRAAKGAAKAVVRAGRKVKGSKLPQQPPTTFVAAAYSTGSRTGKPIIIRNSDDSVTIKHRELVAKVSGTANYTSSTISINPGLSSVFPWLSSQTTGWEKYRFNSLRASFVTRTGSATVGTMMMVPDYDAADLPPPNDIAASTYHGASDDAPWKDQEVNFDMKRSKELFIRYGPLVANLDVKTYDFANLFLITTDGAAVTWGRVYLEYSVTLYNSQFIQATGTGAAAQGTVGTTPALPFGTAPNVSGGSYVSSITSNGTNSVINFSNLSIGATYQFWVQCLGTGITAINSTGSMSGFTLKTTLQNDIGSATSMNDLATLTATSGSGTITVFATGTTVTVTNMTFTLIPTFGAF